MSFPSVLVNETGLLPNSPSNEAYPRASIETSRYVPVARGAKRNAPPGPVVVDHAPLSCEKVSSAPAMPAFVSASRTVPSSAPGARLRAARISTRFASWIAGAAS